MNSDIFMTFRYRNNIITSAILYFRLDSLIFSFSFNLGWSVPECVVYQLSEIFGHRVIRAALECLEEYGWHMDTNNHIVSPQL